MKKKHPAYRIPLFLSFLGLVGIHVPILNLILAFLGIVVLIPMAVLIILLPVLWVIAKIRKWNKWVLWSQVGILSIIACYVVPRISFWAVNELQDYQMDRLADTLDQYKSEKGYFPEEIGSAAPSYLSLGIHYNPYLTVKGAS